MLAPIVRRTWAPRGCTPVIRVSEPHGRISAIGAITIGPNRRDFGLHFHLLADNANFKGDSIASFLEEMRCVVSGPITLLWDQIPVHFAVPVRKYFAKHRRIVVEPLPQYAPELNPVDYVWSYVKYARLSNYCPRNLNELRGRVTEELTRLQGRADLLGSFFKHTGLTL